MSSFFIPGLTSDNSILQKLEQEVDDKPLFKKPTTFIQPNVQEKRELDLVTQQKQIDALLPNHSKTVAEMQEEAILEKRQQAEEQFGFLNSWDTGNKINDDMSYLFDSPENVPIFSVALMGTNPQITLADEIEIDQATFAGSSTWGKLIDPESSVPQVTELIARNAQTNVYMALRARGGAKGELWEDVKKKSPYLAEMLQESPFAQEQLQGWIDSSPYFFNLESSIPLSAYAGRTMLDVLNEDVAPEGWDAKKAVDELELTSPKFATYLYEQIGVKKEDLIEAATNPTKFKYFIADAIDTAAFYQILQKYASEHSAVVNTWSTIAWPLLRDSFNSNDTTSELMITGGLALLTATGVGAPAALIIGGTRVANRIRKIADKAEDLAKAYERALRYSRRVRNVSEFIYKYGTKVLPSNLTDTALEAFYKMRGTRTRIPLDELSKTRRFFTEVGKRFVGEGAQGIAESIVLQREAINTGLQESFSSEAVAWNALEEGIGGLVLGTGISYSQKEIGNLVFKRWEGAVSKNIAKTTERYIIKPIQDRLPSISDERKRQLDLFALATIGNADLEALSPEDRIRVFRDKLQLNNALNYLEQIKFNGLAPNDNSNPIVNAVVDTITNGDKTKETQAKFQLLMLLGRTITEKNLNADDVETLLLLLPGTSRGDKTKFVEAMWYKERTKNLPSFNPNKPPDFKDKEGNKVAFKDAFAKLATEEEITEIAKQLALKENELSVKLGLSNSTELKEAMKALNPDEFALMEDVVKEAVRRDPTVTVTDNGIAGNITESISQDAKNETASELPEDIDRTQDQVDLTKLKENDEVSFNYQGGSTPGKKRNVRIVSNKNGIIKAIDLETNQERVFRADRIKNAKVNKTKPVDKTKTDLSLSERLDKIGIKPNSLFITETPEYFAFTQNYSRLYLTMKILNVKINPENNTIDIEYIDIKETSKTITIDIDTLKEFEQGYLSHFDTTDPELRFIFNNSKGRYSMESLTDLFIKNKMQTKQELLIIVAQDLLIKGEAEFEAGNIDPSDTLSNKDTDDLNNRGCSR